MKNAKTANRIRRALCEPLDRRVLFAAASVNFNDVRQTVDGFGSETTWGDNLTLSDTLAEQLYSQTTGIGLSMVRGSVNANGTSRQAAWDQKAQRYGVKLLKSPRGPVVAWLTDFDADSGYLDPSHYQEYANVVADFLENSAAQGNPIDAISMAVEPDLHTEIVPTWTGKSFAELLPYFGETFKARGLTTKIMANEDVGWTFQDLNRILADPDLSQYLDIVAAHGYGQSYNGYGAVTNAQGRPIWMTENIVDATGLTEIQHMGRVADDIARAFNLSGVSAYLYYWPSFLMNGSTPLKGFWAMGNYSRFVRPGWVRVGETDDGGLQLTTFKDPASGKFAIVANNTGSSSITESYTLNGLSANSVTPYVTSATDNLAAYSNIAVNGGMFTATIPANSVVTYYGVSSAAPTLQAPARLTAAPNSGAMTTQIALSWTDNSSTETGYTVERSANGIDGWSVRTSTLAANTTGFIDTGLSEATTYYYRTKSNDAAAGSAYSGVVSASTLLAAPTALNVSTGTTGNTLTWTRGSGVNTGVKIQRSTDGLNWTTVATSTTNLTAYTDTVAGYNAKQIYSYRVRNTLGTRTSAYVQKNTTVRTPIGFTAASVRPNAVTLNWTNDAVGAYAAYIRQNGSAISPAGLGINAGTYTVSGLTENTSYTFQMAALGPDSWYRPSVGVFYGAFSGYTPNVVVTTPIAPPTALTAVSTTAGTATLAWADKSSVETAYEVARSTDGATWTTLTNSLAAGTTTYTDAAMPTAGAVYYRVRAVVSSTANSAYATTQTVAALATISGTTPVAGKAVNLSAVTPAGFGTAGLTYAWSLDGTPPGVVTFSANGTAAAAATTATFTAAGSYAFRVTITDANGISTTATRTVVVTPVATTVKVEDSAARASYGGPAVTTPSVAAATWQQLSATVYDQFGNALSTQPAVSWSVLSGGGSVSGGGLYTAPATAATPVVRATAGAASGQITLSVVATPLPVVRYAFDQTSGHTLPDTGTAGVAAKMSGGTTFTAGRAGNAVDFNGTDGSVWIDQSAAVDIRGQITMAAWVRPDSLAGTQTILARGYGVWPNSTGTFLRIANGQYQVGYYDGGYRTAAVAVPAGDLGQWVHLVGTYDGKAWNLYRNGTLAATFAAGRGSVYVDRAWRIGSNDNHQSPTDYFNGKIDSASLYAQALSAAGVAALYARPAITVTTPAAATPINTTTNTSTLSVAAVAPDSASDALFTYTWSVTDKPAEATNPAFGVNGTNAAKSAVATFASPGLYRLTVTIADPGGATATSSVNVVVPGVGDPTVAVAAAASPAVVTARTTTLSTLGQDDGGESGLQYLWTAAGPAAVSYSANGTNAAKNTVATFAAAGTYTFTAAIIDANGQAVTSSVVVTVTATLTSIAVTPDTPLVNPGQTQQLAANGRDQFGNAIDAGAITWAITGGAGGLSTGGLFTAPTAQGGLVAVRASGGGGVSGTAVVSVPMDNLDTGGGVTLSGGWTNSTTAGTWFGSNYAYSNTVGNTVTYRPAVPVAGRYAVYAWWAAQAATRASNAAIDVVSTQGVATVRVNQKLNDGQWVLVGTYAFDKGTAGSVTVRTPPDKDGSVIADAVRFQLIDPAPTLVSAVSRKGVGANRVDRAIGLDAASLTVESRTGGPTSIVLTFSEPLSAIDGLLSANEFSVTNATFVSATLSGVDLTVNLANVVNATRVSVGVTGLADAAGTAVSGTGLITMRALAGDVDRNGSVNFNDFLTLQSQFGQASPAGLDSDLDANGYVDFNDFLLLQSGFGSSVA